MVAFKGALIDLGGVVYVGTTPLAGAVEAIARLHKAKLPVRFLTNTTRTPFKTLQGQLKRMGLAVAAEELLTPALAARRIIEAEGLQPHFLIHPALHADFKGLAPGKQEAVVIGDAGAKFTYPALNAAFRALNRGATFLALANNRSFRDADGQLSLDAGPFVAALSFASGREPRVLGKPSPDFFEAGLKALGCRAEEAVMIGDDVEGDVAGAMAAGIAGVLVRTGKYETGAEASITPPPTFLAEDLAAAVDWTLSRT